MRGSCTPIQHLSDPSGSAIPGPRVARHRPAEYQEGMPAPVETWMTAYLTAWTSNDADDIRALFTPDARYHPAPHVRAEVGHDRIVAWWQASRDEPGQWRFSWETVAATDQTAVVRGVTAYA